MGQPFSAYTKVFDGILGAHSREASTLKIPLYGVDFRLNETPILSARYAGTGGVEGPVSLKGTWKPRAYGSCRYVEPVRVSAAYVVFQVHDGACYDIPTVYENALSLGAPVATAATYADLIALSLKPGEWAKAPAVGMYRLGGEPSGKVSADVQGDTTGGSTLSAITSAILKRAGVLAADIDTTSINAVASSIQWNAYLTDQAMVGEVLKSAFAGAGLYLFADEAGVMRAGSWLADGDILAASSATALAPGLDLTIFDSTGTDNHPENFEQLKARARAPVYSTTTVANIATGFEGIDLPNGGDRFASLFVGFIAIDEDGEWEFGVDGDDAVSVEIGGTLVTAWYSGHGSAGDAGASHRNAIRLTKGLHRVIFRHEEIGGGNSAYLGYRSPTMIAAGDAMMIAPPSMFRREVNANYTVASGSLKQEHAHRNPVQRSSANGSVLRRGCRDRQ